LLSGGCCLFPQRTLESPFPLDDFVSFMSLAPVENFQPKPSCASASGQFSPVFETTDSALYWDLHCSKQGTVVHEAVILPQPWLVSRTLWPLMEPHCRHCSLILFYGAGFPFPGAADLRGPDLREEDAVTPSACAEPHTAPNKHFTDQSRNPTSLAPGSPLSLNSRCFLPAGLHGFSCFPIVTG
jgi:hypothetical protein